MLQRVLILLVWTGMVCAQKQQQFKFLQDCNKAPTKAARDVCFGLQKMARVQGPSNWTTLIRPPDFLEPGPISPGSRGQVASHPYDCMTMTCLCPYFRGQLKSNYCVLQNGDVLKMAFRKEYRMMTEDERNRFHNAMRALKLSGEFDRLCNEHESVGTGSGAHSGPGFLPWHREFLKRVEIGLRLVDPTVSIPYWDNVMDNYLPDPRDSIIFSQIFEGETDNFGNLITGPYAFWRTTEGRGAIMRLLGQEGTLWTETTIARVMQQNWIANVLHYTAPLEGCAMPVNLDALEFVHSYIHLWLGGHMRDPPTAANDPIFYPYHAFVDFIWELWRQTHQTPQARQTEYSMDLALCSDPQHFSYAPMRPYFNLINLDGLSNMYTDQMYRYAPRAGCTAQSPTCGSRYLFCDTRGFPHCVSKIKPFGLCVGFEGFDACFNSVCRAGRCVPEATPPPFVPQTELPAAERVQLSQSQASREFVACFNRNPCCELWARDGECRRSGEYMRNFCAAACDVCRPAYNVTNDCADRHVSCQQWRSEQQCHGKSEQFMQENCRYSCGLCTTPKSANCPRRDAARAQKKEKQPQAGERDRTEHQTEADKPKHENQEPKHENENPKHGNEDPKQENQTPKHEDENPKHENQDPKQENQTPKHEDENPKHENKNRTITARTQKKEKRPQEEERDRVEHQTEADKPKHENQNPKQENQTPKRENQHPIRENQTPKQENQTPKRRNQKPKNENQHPIRENQNAKRENQNAKRENQKPKQGNQKPKQGNQHPKRENKNRRLRTVRPKSRNRKHARQHRRGH